ncbi:type II secretion system F family protein [Alkaliphilus pronyensis]|nr:hypothetical protein [Alkaliphilus pronyensis]
MLVLYRIIIIMAMFFSLFKLGGMLLNVEVASLLLPVKKTDKRVKNYSEILKEQRRREILRSKPSISENIKKKIVLTIELSGMDVTLNRFLKYSIGFSSIGIIAGYVLRNPIMMIILGLLSSAIPYIYIQNKAKVKFQLINQLLPSVMGNIIAQFLQESDIVTAVIKKLDQIPEPLNKYFNSFVNEVQVLNVDTIKALEHLEEKIDNYYFKEFIKLAIQTEKQGQQLKYTMVTIPEDMRDLQQVQGDFDLVRKKYNREFIATLIFFPLNLLILRFGYKGYYDLLVYDYRGKITLGAIAIILIVVSYKMYHDNKPVKVELD